MLLFVFLSNAAFCQHFDQAFKLLLEDEGGFVHSLPGETGCTKYGISQSAHPTIKVSTLTVSQAKRIYYNRYWLVHDADSIKSFHIAYLVLNTGALVGHQRMKHILARSLRNVGVHVSWQAVSGKHVNQVPEAILVLSLRSEIRDYYHRVVTAKPCKKRYLKVWLKRLYRF